MVEGFLLSSGENPFCQSLLYRDLEWYGRSCKSRERMMVGGECRSKWYVAA